MCLGSSEGCLSGLRTVPFSLYLQNLLSVQADGEIEGESSLEFLLTRAGIPS